MKLKGSISSQRVVEESEPRFANFAPRRASLREIEWMSVARLVAGGDDFLAYAHRYFLHCFSCASRIDSSSADFAGAGCQKCCQECSRAAVRVAGQRCELPAREGTARVPGDRVKRDKFSARMTAAWCAADSLRPLCFATHGCFASRISKHRSE